MNDRQSGKDTSNPTSIAAATWVKILVLACIALLLQIGVAQEPKLQAHRTVLESGNVPGSYFGVAVAASGDTVVVASYTKGVGVYVRPAGGWQNVTAPTAVLTASDTSDGMGAVAIDGDLIVAAPMYTNEAYVFVKPPTGWVNATESARLATTGELYWSYSIAIAGDTIAVGFPAARFGMNTQQGAVGIYVKPERGWANMTPTAVLTASDGAVGDKLGSTVAVTNGTVAAGAPIATVKSLPQAGALYVFDKPTEGWQSMTQTAKLTANTPVQGDELGLCLGMQGNLIAAGAQDTQYVAIYQKPSEGWSNMTSTAQLNSPPNAYSFGTSVAIISNVVAVGAPFAPILVNYGQIYLFKEPKNGWQTTSTPNAAIKAGSAGGQQSLGFSVSGSSSSGLVTGAVGYNNDAGIAYVFSLQ
jgi:FG-GAP repeat